MSAVSAQICAAAAGHGEGWPNCRPLANGDKWGRPCQGAWVEAKPPCCGVVAGVGGSWSGVLLPCTTLPCKNRPLWQRFLVDR
jgi:hypothetical protein